MAEETPMSPISEAVPPKANPLATPATAHAATLKLNPIARKPTAGAATALKPGIKLPQKPGLPSGLKLPPKPGATVNGLKAGIKLPTQSALKSGLKLPTQSALKPGVKLPSRPVIRKPGEMASAPAPVPVTPATPAAPVAELTPVANVPKPEQPKPLETLKTITQNLKSITSPIPQQAVLRKTGIIADAEMTEAQKQAAKAKTARISLSDAMGVAPIKDTPLPMKTIRIKRPVDLASNATPAEAAKPAAPVSAPAQSAATPAQPAAAKPATAAQSTSFTQRKTMKISRPGSGAVRPSGKFGVKKPVSTSAKTVTATPTGAGDVADIPDMPSVPSMPVPHMQDTVPDVSKGVATTGLIVQIAACLAIAFLVWQLYQNAQLPLYCGGLGM